MALDKLKESASLSEAVEFTNNIKNEISTIKTTLANNIVGKNVTASNAESLSSLVGKVNSEYLKAKETALWYSELFGDGNY